MSSNRNLVTQDSIHIIEKLAAVCATPGINQDTQDIANKHMQELLNGPIKAMVTELKAASSGIVTLS